MESLSACKEIELFELDPIQTIINFKWHIFAKKFFLIQFAIFTLFTILFITDIYFFILLGD